MADAGDTEAAVAGSEAGEAEEEPMTWRRDKTSELRVELTPELEAKLSEPPLRAYLVEKYDKAAQRHWDTFYQHNTVNFYKDRHWVLGEFPELAAGPVRMLEAGCGVGNTVFPLLAECPQMFAYACDFSARAVGFVRAHASYDPERCTAFQADLVANALTEHVPPASLDFVTLFFALTAISPAKFGAAVENLASVLKPGGAVLMRDYGAYDHAMLRFKKGQKLQDRFYVRSDGTRNYYFTTEELSELFATHGFDVAELTYLLTETKNRKTQINVQRVFVQGKFVKRKTKADDV